MINELLETFVVYRYIMYAIIFMLGACIGSFSMVIATRGISGESPWKGRSHCCSCGHVLNIVDLLPVFGWIIRGGKCKYCKAKIDIKYMLIELACGIAYTSVFRIYRVHIVTLIYFIVFALMVITSIYDIETGEISDLYTLPIMGLCIVAGCLTSNTYNIIAAVFIGLIIGVLGYIFKDKIGGADIIVIIGIIFTLDVLQFAVYLQLAGILGILYILIRHKFNKESKIMGVEVRFLPILYVAYVLVLNIVPYIKLNIYY